MPTAAMVGVLIPDADMDPPQTLLLVYDSSAAGHVGAALEVRLCLSSAAA